MTSSIILGKTKYEPYQIKRSVRDAHIVGQVENLCAWRGQVLYKRPLWGKSELMTVEGISLKETEQPTLWYRLFHVFERYRVHLTTGEEQHEEDWHHFPEEDLSQEVKLRLTERFQQQLKREQQQEERKRSGPKRGFGERKPFLLHIPLDVQEALDAVAILEPDYTEFILEAIRIHPKIALLLKEHRRAGSLSQTTTLADAVELLQALITRYGATARFDLCLRHHRVVRIDRERINEALLARAQPAYLCVDLACPWVGAVVIASAEGSGAYPLHLGRRCELYPLTPPAGVEVVPAMLEHYEQALLDSLNFGSGDSAYVPEARWEFDERGGERS